MESISLERLMEIAFDRQRPTLDELKLLDSNILARDRLLKIMDLRDQVKQPQLFEKEAESAIASVYEALARTGANPAITRSLAKALPSFERHARFPSLLLREVTRPETRPLSMALDESSWNPDSNVIPALKWDIEAPVEEFGGSTVVAGLTIAGMTIDLYGDGRLVIEPQAELRHSGGYRLSAELRSGVTSASRGVGTVICGPHEFDPLILQLPDDSPPASGDRLEVEYESELPGGPVKLKMNVVFP